jgi:hypothetical protein
MTASTLLLPFGTQAIAATLLRVCACSNGRVFFDAFAHKVLASGTELSETTSSGVR